MSAGEDDLISSQSSPGIHGYNIEKLAVNEESLASELASAAKNVADKEATSGDESNVSKESDSGNEDPMNINLNNSNSNSTSRDPALWMGGDSELSDIEEISETSDKLEHRLNHEMEHQLGLGKKPGLGCSGSPKVLNKQN